MEEKLAALEAKIDALYQAISDTELESDKTEFTNKWQDAVSEVEPFQKKIYGDDWKEMDGLFNHHRKHMNDEGYDEDKVINGYLDAIKAKFQSLKEEAPTEEAKEAVEQAEEQAIEAVETAVESAEQDVASEEETSEDEIKGYLAESDFALMR